MRLHLAVLAVLAGFAKQTWQRIWNGWKGTTGALVNFADVWEAEDILEELMRGVPRS